MPGGSRRSPADRSRRARIGRARDRGRLVVLGREVGDQRVGAATIAPPSSCTRPAAARLEHAHPVASKRRAHPESRGSRCPSPNDRFPAVPPTFGRRRVAARHHCIRRPSSVEAPLQPSVALAPDGRSRPHDPPSWSLSPARARLSLAQRRRGPNSRRPGSRSSASRSAPPSLWSRCCRGHRRFRCSRAPGNLRSTRGSRHDRPPPRSARSCCSRRCRSRSRRVCRLVTKSSRNLSPALTSDGRSAQSAGTIPIAGSPGLEIGPSPGSIVTGVPSTLWPDWSAWAG